MKRVGLLGGSFNPVHLGHLMVAQNALETFDLDRVRFLLSGVAPHKTRAPRPEAEHRLAMLRLATEHNLAFDICEDEIRRGGVSYTVDTLERLHRQHPDTRFVFLIGSDTLPELHGWKEIGRLLTLCDFATFARPGFEFAAMTPSSLKLPPPWPEKLLSQTAIGVRMDLSSSDIRHRVAEGMSIRYMVPPEVEMYIMEHGLYRRGDA